MCVTGESDPSIRSSHAHCFKCCWGNQSQLSIWRSHAYQGRRVIMYLVCRRAIYENWNNKYYMGSFSFFQDHIFLPGLAGMSPLVGINDDRFGARFVSVHDSYDKNFRWVKKNKWSQWEIFRKLAMDVATDQGIRVFEGIYVMCGGPQYESPAEVIIPRFSHDCKWVFRFLYLKLWEQMPWVCQLVMRWRWLVNAE